MKTLYQASNSLEAHMILNLIEQHGLTGRVDGEYLQGGIGELPAAGLVRVMVAEQDYPAAKAIIDKWDAAQPGKEDSRPVPQVRSRVNVFVAGLLAGLACAYFYYRGPISSDGIDFNDDGVPDLRWSYSASGRQTGTEHDRNLDGKTDLVYRFGRDGTTETIESDDNFDGIFESRITFRNENPVLNETDTNGDGYPDLRTNYEHGVATSVEYINPASGLPLKIEYFERGKLAYAERDTDRDGRMDMRTTYDDLAEIVSVQPIE